MSLLTRFWITVLVLLLAAIPLAGCAEPHFTGLTPSSRTFNELPSSTRDYYVGVDANFAVGHPEIQQGAAGAAAAQAKSATQPALMPSTTSQRPQP